MTPSQLMTSIRVERENFRREREAFARERKQAVAEWERSKQQYAARLARCFETKSAADARGAFEQALFQFEAKTVDSAGQFSGHAAVFGNTDLQGDKIRRGAFQQSIEESGGRWPILFAHSTQRVVGFSTRAEEDSKGLYVEGEFTMNSAEGRNAYATVKHAAELGQKFGLSIGYAIRGDDGASYDSGTGVRTLKNLTVYEFSLAAIPANPRARISSVKTAGIGTDDSGLSELHRILANYG